MPILLYLKVIFRKVGRGQKTYHLQFSFFCLFPSGVSSNILLQFEHSILVCINELFLGIQLSGSSYSPGISLIISFLLLQIQLSQKLLEGLTFHRNSLLIGISFSPHYLHSSFHPIKKSLLYYFLNVIIQLQNFILLHCQHSLHSSCLITFMLQDHLFAVTIIFCSRESL